MVCMFLFRHKHSSPHLINVTLTPYLSYLLRNLFFFAPV